MSYHGVALSISQTSLATVGVNVSPHLFRTSGATTAAIHGGNLPHLASAVLHHQEPSVTEKHYNRASSLTAAKTYQDIIAGYRT